MSQSSEVKTASVEMSGELLKAFNTIKADIKTRVPGLDPNNAEVVRAAIFMAAELVTEAKRSAGAYPAPAGADEEAA